MAGCTAPRTLILMNRLSSINPVPGQYTRGLNVVGVVLYCTCPRANPEVEHHPHVLLPVVEHLRVRGHA
jgi:uncharacterized Zn-finger protein